MKIDKVSYQKAYIIGPYLQEKIGFEASIDGDSPEEVLSKLRTMADDWHKENNPGLESNLGTLADIHTEKQPIEARAALMRRDILNSKDLAELQTYTIFVTQNPQFADAYNQRLKELTT